MLPSSHSLSGRWTCRSTARIKLRREWLCFFDHDRIADVDRPAEDHPRDHAAPALELLSQAVADLIHSEAWLADLGNLQHRACPEVQPTSHWKLHHVQPLDGQVLLDGAGLNVNRVQRLLIRQEHLPVGGADRVLVALQTETGDEGRGRHQPHRLTVSRAELNGNEAARTR